MLPCRAYPAADPSVAAGVNPSVPSGRPQLAGEIGQDEAGARALTVHAQVPIPRASARVVAEGRLAHGVQRDMLERA